MKKRTSPKNLRKPATAKWGIYTGAVTLGTLTDASGGMYFQTDTTSVTFPSGTFNGFAIGDVITITGGANSPEPKKVKKVHVARRYRKEKPVTHTITNVSETTMTIAVNDLVTATKLSEDSWSVYSQAGTIII